MTQAHKYICDASTQALTGVTSFETPRELFENGELVLHGQRYYVNVLWFSQAPGHADGLMVKLGGPIEDNVAVNIVMEPVRYDPDLIGKRVRILDGGDYHNEFGRVMKLVRLNVRDREAAYVVEIEMRGQSLTTRRNGFVLV